jgi:hypothetical protein
MATKVKFLSTSAGDYGLAKEGDEIVVSNAVAAKLEKSGAVEVLGETDEDIHKPEAGSVAFTDNTTKSDAPAEDTKATGTKTAPKKGAAKKSGKNK